MANVVALLGSIETLLADVKKVRSSEMSLKKFSTMIEEEFRMESKHMETNEDVKKEQKGKRNNIALPILKRSFKRLIGLIFILMFAFILAPEETSETVYNIQESLFTQDLSTAPEYNISYTHWYFKLLKFLRLGSTSLCLERKFLITDIDPEACFIDNPLFKPSREKCSFCKRITGFVPNGIEDDEDRMESPIIKMRKDIRFSIARLQQILLKNKMMNQHIMSVQTNSNYIHTVEDLKDNEVLERLESDQASHIFCKSLSYMSSHILRKEFPKPQDFFNVAHTYQSHLYIDGKNSSSFQLDNALVYTSFMYIQCSGSRRLVFFPPSNCYSKCYTFSRIMKTGDIVFYSSKWTVRSEATNERSLAYVDTFEWLG